MRNHHRLLAAAALLAVPAAPAEALPVCGGTWTKYALCTFDAPAGAFAVKGTAATGSQGHGSTGWVSVRVYVEFGGVQHTVGSCANRGTTPVSCTTLVNTPFDGWSHYCEVFGERSGTFACADPPRVPLPDAT